MIIEKHPNPQFSRENFTLLDGVWNFACGKETEGIEWKKILVPYCPESKKSGLAIQDKIYDCVYEREIEVQNLLEGERVVLHFGAVDYEATVLVNGKKMGFHRGGYAHFEVDATSALVEGKNKITVLVHDDERENIPKGKQTDTEPHGCFYTPVTGIWQSVWMERTPNHYVTSLKFYPSVKEKKVDVEVKTEGEEPIKIQVFYEGRQVGVAEGVVNFCEHFEIPLKETHLWEIGKGRLYEVQITFGKDVVHSYFGLRSTEFSGKKYLLNGKNVFQRLVLDQGYYPDGIYTGTEEEWQSDLNLSIRLGFNGSRLHQKVFEPKYLYLCDKMGYMVWGEYPNWGVDFFNLNALGAMLDEWREVVELHFNHPSIVVWCPLNETWNHLKMAEKHRDVRLVETIYAFTKILDSTRPCVDVSGGHHGRYTDCFDFHCYYPSDRLKSALADLEERGELTMEFIYPDEKVKNFEKIALEEGQPTQISEYGGVRLGEGEGWGYEVQPTEEKFVEEYTKQTASILACKKISGFCYTQLYDVEQEENGLVKYDRTPKLSEKAMDEIAKINRAPSAIERENKKKISFYISLKQ